MIICKVLYFIAIHEEILKALHYSFKHFVYLVVKREWLNWFTTIIIIHKILKISILGAYYYQIFVQIRVWENDNRVRKYPHPTSLINSFLFEYYFSNFSTKRSRIVAVSALVILAFGSTTFPFLPLIKLFLVAHSIGVNKGTVLLFNHYSLILWILIY